MAKPHETERMKLEGYVRDIGETIQGALPAHVGYALVVFDFGEKGDMAYVSNATRADTIKLLRELAQKLEGS